MKKWLPLLLLALAQFVMILDSTVMNVSISTVAKDLGTTISGMQAAITLYALTMAAFMLIGGKFGDKFGRRKMFVIGAIIYGLGSLITALSPNLTTLLFGWSLVEGLGAVLVIPAIAALTALNYKGADRLKAFAIIGAVAGLAAALGPVIGGFVTTYLSWRYVFIAEVIIIIGILLFYKRIKDIPVTSKVRIDIPSALMSASGMALIVFGALQSKSWGWIQPINSPVIAGQSIEPLGISLVAYFITIGALLLWAFMRRQAALVAAGTSPLLSPQLLKLPVLRSGLAVLLAQYFVIAAVFFIIPVYLQTILGYDALETGIRLVPLSVGLIIFTLIGSRLVGQFGPKRVVRYGQLALSIGSLFLLASITPDLASFAFLTGLFIVGAGLGLLASQLGNVNLSAVPKENTSEVGGLQGTYQNLGSSFGTALAGSVFMIVLTAGFTTSIQSSSLSAPLKQALTSETQSGLPIVSPDDASLLLQQNGVSTDESQQVAASYETAQIQALRTTMFIVFAVSLLALVASRNIPSVKNS